MAGGEGPIEQADLPVESGSETCDAAQDTLNSIDDTPDNEAEVKDCLAKADTSLNSANPDKENNPKYTPRNKDSMLNGSGKRTPEEERSIDKDKLSLLIAELAQVNSNINSTARKMIIPNNEEGNTRQNQLEEQIAGLSDKLNLNNDIPVTEEKPSNSALVKGGLAEKKSNKNKTNSDNGGVSYKGEKIEHDNGEQLSIEGDTKSVSFKEDGDNIIVSGINKDGSVFTDSFKNPTIVTNSPSKGSPRGTKPFSSDAPNKSVSNEALMAKKFPKEDQNLPPVIEADQKVLVSEGNPEDGVAPVEELPNNNNNGISSYDQGVLSFEDGKIKSPSANASNGVDEIILSEGEKTEVGQEGEKTEVAQATEELDNGGSGEALPSEADENGGSAENPQEKLMANKRQKVMREAGLGDSGSIDKSVFSQKNEETGLSGVMEGGLDLDIPTISDSIGINEGVAETEISGDPSVENSNALNGLISSTEMPEGYGLNIEGGKMILSGNGHESYATIGNEENKDLFTQKGIQQWVNKRTSGWA